MRMRPPTFDPTSTIFSNFSSIGVSATTMRLLGYQTRCAGLYDLVTHPTILDHVQDLIGPDIICWTSHAFCKAAFDPKRIPFHQDASYWPLTPARTVTVWLAIDDADRENSCLQVIPRTHRMGHLKYTGKSRPISCSIGKSTTWPLTESRSTWN